MFHPLGPNLKDLSTEELHKKYNELISRYNQAFKFGPHGVLSQLQMLMSDYQSEIQVRNRKQMEEMEQASKNFKNIIDIK